MEITNFSEKENTLYILTDAIMPYPHDRKTWKQAFSESYEQRIEKYATKQNREIIEKEIQSHPGCKISEYICI